MRPTRPGDRARVAALVILLALSGCRQGDPGEAATPEDTLPPHLYCEETVESFCGFYMRCGRMAVGSLDACRAAFLETCNGRFEPYYAALAEAGLLRLSRAGVTACEAHLAEVACEQQLQDLDGGCSGMWLGAEPEGGACGVGIDSLVCAAGTACVVSLDLCGTCRPVVGAGETCGVEVTCGRAGRCAAGVCELRAAVGEPCGDGCVLGAHCDDGVCTAPAYAGIGESCDAYTRCRYMAACAGGTCEASALLGETCGTITPCESGRCAPAAGDDACAPLLGPGEDCSAASDCVSGRCAGGRCDSIPGACLRDG